MSSAEAETEAAQSRDSMPSLAGLPRTRAPPASQAQVGDQCLTPGEHGLGAPRPLRLLPIAAPHATFDLPLDGCSCRLSRGDAAR